MHTSLTVLFSVSAMDPAPPPNVSQIGGDGSGRARPEIHVISSFVANQALDYFVVVDGSDNATRTSGPCRIRITGP